MGFYFPDHQSMYARAGLQVEKTLEAVMRRFVGLNPPHPLTFRAYHPHGILREQDCRYRADYAQLFPETPDGNYVYAWAKMWADADSNILFDLNCHCPTVIYINQAQVFRSSIFEERYPEKRHRLTLSLKAGWNHFVVRVKKTRGGFGGIWGTWLGKLPYYFLFPTPERDGQEGWLYSEPTAHELSVIPGANSKVEDTGVAWHPRVQWSEEKRALGQLERIFGRAPGASAVGWTRGTFAGQSTYTLRGSHRSSLTVTIDGVSVFSSEKPGSFSADIKVSPGLHDIFVTSDCGSSGWGFELTITDGSSPVKFISPCNITGSSQVWIYAGPFAKGQRPDFAALSDLHHLVKSANGDTYWRLDAPGDWVRLYNDNPNYGQWNYPLGVTLYGLLHSAKAIGSTDTQQYVADHMQRCCDVYTYAMWDRKQYGGATNVHHLLTSLDSLDDCGSSGSAMLEIAKHAELTDYREIADLVAHYITHEQIRLEDGTFFRKNLMHEFHEDTMWADDLYMSVPFLCRYYQLTGDRRYIDDAARQFLGFKKRLYIPQWKLMSHVFDFTRGMATGIPWGRGNGWVIFSLSELLAVLPSDHPLRPDLLQFFTDLCEGYLAQQDASGMWHQVLNEHDSYPETSCTSMFIYAFARGVQHGWLEKPERFVRAVFSGWEALNRTSIDQHGNVHGVCRGPEFSFQSEYYKRDLLWNLNDTHGVGIVLLAGVEFRKLLNFLQPAALANRGQPALV